MRPTLPLAPTPLVDRGRELALLRERLLHPHVRLVTLTGPAGVGKTRLALELAAELFDAFQHSAGFVYLAPITDPVLVASAIAQGLGVQEVSSQPLLEMLKSTLRERELLLVLDNFEQVIPAAPQVAELLEACPALKLLVTSREPLHLSWEHQLSVPPLSLPDLASLPEPPALSATPAVALFLQRAQAIDPAFALTDRNAADVAELCVHLDGLPLALELAATRIKLLPPRAMLARLKRRLELLTTGQVDLPARHQTLREAIAWSYRLLTPEEQSLFRRLAAFVGGCTLEAVAAVVQRRSAGLEVQPEESGGLEPGTLTLELDVLDGLASLANKSLLRQEATPEGEPRFGMLETIREYALEQLEASEELETIQLRHAEHYLAVAERAEAHLTGPDQVAWLDRLEREHDNLRAALGWAIDHGQAETALRLGGALSLFWVVRGHLSEGLQWLEAALASSPEQPTSARVKALNGAGYVASYWGDYPRASALYAEALAIGRPLGDTRAIADALNGLGYVGIQQGDYATAQVQYEESLALCRELGHKASIAEALNGLVGVAYNRGDYSTARLRIDESLALRRELGDKRSIAMLLNNLGYNCWQQGDYRAARACHEEALELYRELGDKRGVAHVLDMLGNLAREQGDLEQAERLIEASLTASRESGDPREIAMSLQALGEVELQGRNYRRAARLFQDSLSLLREVGFKVATAVCLEGLAGVACGLKQPDRAARLFGATEALREAIEAPLPPARRADHARRVAAARAGLGEQAFGVAWAEGRAMALEQAIEHGLSEASGLANLDSRVAPQEARRETREAHPVLTAREREVAVLVARGLTNRRIAEELVISERTADTHVSNILNKLGLASRAQVAAWVVQQGLLPSWSA